MKKNAIPITNIESIRVKEGGHYYSDANVGFYFCVIGTIFMGANEPNVAFLRLAITPSR